MNLPDKYSDSIPRYLDGELSGQELADFESHLQSCAQCQLRLEEERALSHLLRQSRPLYSAPAALRARVSATLAQHSAVAAPASETNGTTRKPMALRLAVAMHRISGLRVPALAALVIAFCLLVIPDTVRRVQAENYVDAALATHRSYLSGDLSPQLHTSSPEVVTTWFADKVPFQFRLPNSHSVGEGEPTYQMTGARLVDYKGTPAALVTYQTQAEKISLMVASSKYATVAGGDKIRYGSLTFHYRSDSGFRVITWASHGLSYALVSSVAGSPRQSCLVCHQNMADRQTFR